MSSSKQKRIAGLDALRGLAAMAVLLTHYMGTYYAIYQIPPLFPIDTAAPAVALFFIISGFVILKSIESAGSVGDFAVRRFARLYPVFWASAAVTFTVVHLAAIPGRGTSFRDGLLNLTMTPSFFGAAPIDVVYWSLTCELSFYVIVGLIFALGFRKHVLAVAAGLVIVGVVDHFWPFSTHVPMGFRIERLLILGWWPLFLAGMILFRMRAGFRQIHAAALVFCGAAELLTNSWGGLVNCGMAAVVFLVTNIDMALFRAWPLRKLGSLSYALYLTHANIGYCVIRWMLARGNGQIQAAGIALLVSLAIAGGLHFWIEIPMEGRVRRLLQKPLSGWLSLSSGRGVVTSPPA